MGMAAVRGAGFLAAFSRRWNKTRSKGSRSSHLSLEESEGSLLGD